MTRFALELFPASSFLCEFLLQRFKSFIYPKQYPAQLLHGCDDVLRGKGRFLIPCSDLLLSFCAPFRG